MTDDIEKLFNIINYDNLNQEQEKIIISLEESYYEYGDLTEAQLDLLNKMCDDSYKGITGTG